MLTAPLAPARVRFRTPGETAPNHPKLRLLALLTDEDALARTRQAAECLGGATDARAVQLIHLQAGLFAPPGETLGEAVRALVAMGARAVPAGLEGPQAGDLFVVTGPDRQPARLGFVAKVATEGGWFYGVDGACESRKRVETGGVDYWLRVVG